MAWRVADSLLELREQVNAAHPDRNKDSDGTIGDLAHAKTVSDHNPDATGTVRAFDLTHDPEHGVDIAVIAEALRTSEDPRIKYVIANRRIFSSTVDPWVWRTYSGTDPHTNHVHVSVVSTRSLADDTRPWSLTTNTTQEDDMSDQDVQKVNDYTKALLLDGYTIDGQPKPSVLDVLVETQRRVSKLVAATSQAKIKAAVTAALPAELGPDVDVTALAKAIVLELGRDDDQEAS